MNCKVLECAADAMNHQEVVHSVNKIRSFFRNRCSSDVLTCDVFPGLTVVGASESVISPLLHEYKLQVVQQLINGLFY